ncbi:hypothetical protein BpHYR1_033318 [Brachionus plicatilis]|uniref:Uncharacterized protein n=1 Tax=Brachionus plicatilis TaxID=10195 RepID=A0A3M7SJY3_BRAPC|nr:hypothetical protein BpHYR1_033318 [Brachionus plicatilis]
MCLYLSISYSLNIVSYDYKELRICSARQDNGPLVFQMISFENSLFKWKKTLIILKNFKGLFIFCFKK